MKKLLLLLVAAPLFCYAQKNSKIKISEYDKFSKNYRIETKGVLLKNGLNGGLGFRFRTVDSTIFFQLQGRNIGVGVVGKNASLLFLFDDDSTLTAYSKDVQDYDINLKYGDSYAHEYRISFADVLTLARKRVKAIRMYLSDGYTSYEFKDKSSAQTIEETQALLQEFDKHSSEFGK